MTPTTTSPYYTSAGLDKVRVRATAENIAADQVLSAILAAPVPMERGRIRSLPRKERSKKIRSLLRDLGLRLPVTTPRYSMASATDVDLPRVEHIHGSRRCFECPICDKHSRARKRVEALILAAFPDLVDRSDSMSDHFDFVLSVN